LNAEAGPVIRETKGEMPMHETRREKDKAALAKEAGTSFTTKILALEALFWGYKGARFKDWNRAARYTQSLLDELVAEGVLVKEQEPLLLEEKPRYWRA
jgi:hypothetical protein